MSDTQTIEIKKAVVPDLTEARRLLALGMHLCPLVPHTKHPSGLEWNKPKNRVRQIDDNATGYGLILNPNRIASIDPDNWDDACTGMAALGFDLDSIMETGVRTSSTRPGSGGRAAFQSEGELSHVTFSANGKTVLEFRADKLNLMDTLPGTVYIDKKTEKLCIQQYSNEKRFSLFDDMPGMPNGLFDWWEKCSTDIEFLREQQKIFFAAINEKKGILSISRGKDPKAGNGNGLAFSSHLRGKFNRSHGTIDILIEHGYVPDTKTDRFSPPQCSGLPGVLKVPGKNDLWHSHHASDRLFGTFDAWSAWVVLEHDGNVMSAISAFSKQIGKGKQTSQTPPADVHQEGDDGIPSEKKQSIFDAAFYAGDRYIVSHEFADHDGTFMPPGTYELKLSDKDHNGQQFVIVSRLSDPATIKAHTSDILEMNCGVQIEFSGPTGRQITHTIAFAALAKDGADARAELMDRGLKIEPTRRAQFCEYLQKQRTDKRLTCVTQTGWATHPNSAARAYVTPLHIFGPSAASYAAMLPDHAQIAAYATSGTLESWKARVARPAHDNPLLMTAICAALAGPLLRRAQFGGGGVHFYGPSSTGKTTAGDVGGSVSGPPDHVKKTWRSTSNGLESVAAARNDNLLFLDELRECNPRDVAEVVYMIGNGTGKNRATKSGGHRAPCQFTVSVISTGEMAIKEWIESGGQVFHAGQAVRIVDVPVKEKHGIFSSLNGRRSGAEFSAELNNATRENYGTAGAEFISQLSNDDRDFPAMFEQMKEHPQMAIPTNAEGQVTRVRDRFAALALAGELASEYEITGWPTGSAIAACRHAFDLWLHARSLHDDGLASGAKNDEGTTVLRLLRNFIDKHGSSRFQNLERIEAFSGHAGVVRDQAGWIRKIDGEVRYLFSASGMTEALVGQSLRGAVDHLVSVGVVMVRGGQKMPAVNCGPEGKKRVYIVNADKLQGQTESPASVLTEEVL